MAKELQSTDITTITSVPELLQLVEDVQRSRQPHLLKRQDEQVAMIVPVASTASAAKPSRARDRRTSQYDPLWQIIGIGDAAGSETDPTDVSEHKYKYLGMGSHCSCLNYAEHPQSALTP